MIQPPVQKPVLTIDLKIRFKTKIYRINLTQVVRWAVPIVIIAARVISYFRDNAS